MKRARPHFPLFMAAAFALSVVVATIWQPTALLITGAILATVAVVTTLVVYLVLVPMHRNPGAKRLVGLLVAICLLLLTSVFRYFFGDYPFRIELLTLLFWGLFTSLAYLGWHIWKDQIEGARAYRRHHREKAERNQ